MSTHAETPTTKPQATTTSTTTMRPPSPTTLTRHHSFHTIPVPPSPPRHPNSRPSLHPPSASTTPARPHTTPSSPSSLPTPPSSLTSATMMMRPVLCRVRVADDEEAEEAPVPEEDEEIPYAGDMMDIDSDDMDIDDDQSNLMHVDWVPPSSQQKKQKTPQKYSVFSIPYSYWPSFSCFRSFLPAPALSSSSRLLALVCWRVGVVVMCRFLGGAFSAWLLGWFVWAVFGRLFCVGCFGLCVVGSAAMLLVFGLAASAFVRRWGAVEGTRSKMAVAPPVCCMVMLGTLHCRLSVLEDEGDTLHSRNSWLLHWFTLAQKTPRGTPASTIPQSIVPQALPPHRPHSTVLGRPLECVYA
ncbi:hypothetical protein BDB00DRAFT_926773 [Zychaea mexicana]|uniref:uncharacterized protein n=1 Tax=Zychaea mexicana TaxID=64656 RepID=UPI0022FE2906|nr:uncharacterized protein BDB00DRAFT_926773 [Zychaea mexicana]KAI9496196.1 hypothetical protein BDB00DRAFT_926773 [Zychaea mexicana]